MKKSGIECLVDLAYRQVGKPYRYGAKVSARPKAFDCSGLVQWLYQQAGIKLPRRSLEQASCGRAVPRRSKSLRPGDLLFFTGEYGHYNPRYPQCIGHVAIYVGDSRVIQARGQGRQGKVMVVPLAKLRRRRDLAVIKRLLPP